MKVNPLAPDEKSLLATNKSSLASGLRGRTFKRPEKYQCQQILRVIVEGKIATVVMSLITVFALIGDDIRLWATTKEADPYFYGGLILSFVLFTTEILINSIVDEGFKYSFFFWLDIIATLSLIPDIRWVLDLLALIIGATPSYESVNAIPGVIHVESNATSKVQKVVKSLRLIRLIRIIKLYKYIVQSKKEEEPKQKKRRVTYETTTEEENENSLFKKETDPSKLGKALSDTTTRRVIIGVLLMLMVLPLLTYSETDYSSEYGLREIFWFGRSSCDKASGDFFCDDNTWMTSEGWNELLRQYVESSYGVEGDEITKELLWLFVPNYHQGGRMDSIQYIPKAGSNSSSDPYWTQTAACAGHQVSDDCPYRYEEMDLITYIPLKCIEGEVAGCEQLTAYARFNKRYEKIQEAILQFSTTLFTCFVLTVASLTFNNDTQQIVIKPIQKIVEIIQRLSENPLKKPTPPKKDDELEKNSQMKTQMLELTIFKISTLLQRGFGELGARVVSKTFTHDEDYMDLQRPGKKIQLVFCICRIRQFTETTEALQDEIIVFVNKIVKIVHEVAKKWEGIPTKNYGDKYLLTWKIPQPRRDAKYFRHLIMAGAGQVINVDPLVEQNSVTPRLEQNQLQINTLQVPGASSNQEQTTKKDYRQLMFHDEHDEQEVDQELLEKKRTIADKSLIAAVKIVTELRRAQDLQAYSRHPKIAPKFGQNYRTKVTFGLHAGWAIEGAIGTEQKIDALFISPDSQIALRIEEMCSIYETTLMLSGDLYHMLSEKGKSTLRLVDTVVFNESKEQPRDLYAFDMNFSEEIDQLSSYVDGYEVGGLVRHVEFENSQPELFRTDGVDYMFMIDHDFYTFKLNRNEPFENAYKLAYQAYIQGDWINAQNYITQCLELFPDEGSCLALSDYMEKHKNIAPEDWKGFRDIDEKEAAPSLDFIRAGFDDEFMDDENEEIDDDDSLS